MLSTYLLIGLFIFLIPLSWWWLFFRKKKSRYPVLLPKWKQILEDKIHFYQSLDAKEKARFEQSILQFFEDVTITGVETELDDTDKLLVASSAVIPIFGFPGWRYHNLNEVLLYPDTFDDEYQTRTKERDILGMVGTGAMQRMMILSKPALHQGFDDEHSKNNVGIHEFVHLLDKSDGATDGIPEILMQKQFVLPWLKRMHEEIKAIETGQSDINPYGATKEAEFLSVVSEYFFNQPHLLEAEHPELFVLLEQIYRQDLS